MLAVLWIEWEVNGLGDGFVVARGSGASECDSWRNQRCAFKPKFGTCGQKWKIQRILGKITKKLCNRKD